MRRLLSLAATQTGQALRAADRDLQAWSFSKG
jgi:hypothetical protein